MLICAGEALVDLVPDPVPGGGPFNAAVAAARLGAASAFVGALSTDEHGETIRAHLAANGVDATQCPTVDRPTARAIVEHRPHLVFRFEGDDTADTHLDRLDPSRFGPGPHLLHGGTLGLFRGQTADTLAAAAEGHGGLVSLDPNVRPQIIDDRARWDHYHQRWLAAADLYKGSDEDLDWIWPGREPSSVAEELLAAGVRAVIVTGGAEGVTVVHGGGSVNVSAPTVDVVDTVGAGDTLVAAVLVGLSEAGVVDGAGLAAIDDAAWTVIGRHAVEAAAVTCTRAGADPPHRAELTW